MPLGAKILSELSDDAVRWVESLAKKLSGKESYFEDVDVIKNKPIPEGGLRFPKTSEEAAAEMGQKLVNLDRFAPQMKDIYDDRELYEVLREASEGSSDLALMKPKTFGEAAAAMNPNKDPYIQEMIDKNVLALRDLRSAGIRYSDVPYLSYKEPYPGIAQVTGHEGRHRALALDAEGEPVQLVRMIPRRNEQLLSTMNPDTQLMSEVSTMQPEAGGKEVGTLGQLIKFLGLGGVAAPGALSTLGEENGVQ